MHQVASLLPVAYSVHGFPLGIAIGGGGSRGGGSIPPLSLPRKAKSVTPTPPQGAGAVRGRCRWFVRTGAGDDRRSRIGDWPKVQDWRLAEGPGLATGRRSRIGDWPKVRRRTAPKISASGFVIVSWLHALHRYPTAPWQDHSRKWPSNPLNLRFLSSHTIHRGHRPDPDTSQKALY